MALSISVDTAIAMCNAAADMMDADLPTAGYFVLYNHTPPDNVQAALDQNGTPSIIVTITCDDTAAYQDAAPGGPGAQAAITGTPSGNATAVTGGTPITFYRAFRGNGTPVRQGLCSLTDGGGTMQVSTLIITSIGQTVTVNTATISQPTTSA